MTAPTLEQPRTAAQVEPINLRPAVWLAGHIALAGASGVGLLIAAAAYGVERTTFAAGLALLFAVVALFGIDGIREHRGALLAQINGDTQ